MLWITCWSIGCAQGGGKANCWHYQNKCFQLWCFSPCFAQQQGLQSFIEFRSPETVLLFCLSLPGTMPSMNALLFTRSRWGECMKSYPAELASAFSTNCWRSKLYEFPPPLPETGWKRSLGNCWLLLLGRRTGLTSSRLANTATLQSARPNQMPDQPGPNQMLDQIKCSDRPDALPQLAPFSEGPATRSDFAGFGELLFRETAPDGTIVCLRWASTSGNHAGCSIVLALDC